MIEDCIADLAEASCLRVLENENDIVLTAVGLSSSNSEVKHSSVDLFAQGIQQLYQMLQKAGKPGQLKMKQLFELLL